jgi:RHS repeat-associated protein
VILLADLETPSSSRCSADRKAVFRKNRKSTNLPATAGEKAKSLVPPEDPYGRTTLVSGSSLATKQYAGMYMHQISGLNLTYCRAYDSNTARWLSRDPLKDAERSQGPNLYEYVKNSPIDMTDPLGLAGGGRGNPNGPKCPCGQHLASGFPNTKAAGDLEATMGGGYWGGAAATALAYVPYVNYVAGSWQTLALIYSSPALFTPICVPN